MPDSILVPVDGSDPARAALEFALEKFPEAHVVLYHSINPFNVAERSNPPEKMRSEFWSEQVEEANEESAEILAEAEERVDADSREVEVESEIGPATHNIVSTVEERDVDQVVMGSHGRTGVTRVVMGSVAEKVVRRSPVPVTIVHGEGG